MQGAPLTSMFSIDEEQFCFALSKKWRVKLRVHEVNRKRSGKFYENKPFIPTTRTIYAFTFINEGTHLKRVH